MVYTHALILIDIQQDYFPPNGLFPLVNIEEASQRAGDLLSTVRSSFQDKILIVHIQHIFPKDQPAAFFNAETVGVEIHPNVAPQADELVIVKQYPNSFIQTTLHETLQQHNIQNLILVGAMSQMCIQGTARGAKELGYSVTVAKDAIAAPNLEYDGIAVSAEQVTAAVLATLSFGYATIQTVEEIVQQFQ